MGYRIDYAGDGATDFSARKKGLRVWLTGVCFLGFCFLASGMFPQRWERMTELLLPGDPAVTKTAFSSLTEDLRTGEPVLEALTAFGRVIVDGAEVSG